MKFSSVRISSLSLYIFILLLNIFLLYFFGNYMNLITTAVLIVIPMIMGLSTYLIRRFTTAEILGASYVEDRTDSFLFRVKLTNRSILFCNNALVTVSVQHSASVDSTTHVLTMSVPPMGSFLATYPIKDAHAGILTIQIEKIEYMDLCNFFVFSAFPKVKKEIPILPHIIPVEEEMNASFSDGFDDNEEVKLPGTDTSEVSDIREYIPGDRLMDIHWKLSAKEDKLMVKERMHLSSKQLVFFIEVPAAKPDVADMILDTAYSLGLSFIHKSTPVSFLWYSPFTGELKTHRISEESQLQEAFLELLYEPRISDVEELHRILPSLLGNHHYFTIGEDYVLWEKEEE